MGITTILEAEDGTPLDTIEDPTNVLHRVLPEFGDSGYHCLIYIDWYGNTVFNNLQSQRLLKEWCTLKSDKHDLEAERVLNSIRKLVERLGKEPHIYLKFYGD